MSEDKIYPSMVIRIQAEAIELLEQENKQLKEVIEEVREYNNQIIKDTKDFYRPTEDRIYSGDTLIDIAETNIQILDKGVKND